MSSCFLNLAGAFRGLDQHLYLALAPPDPAPIPVPLCPHIVEQIHLAGDYTKVVSNVTTMTIPVLQAGWKMILVPHVFIPEGPPHPAEWINLAAIIITSSSQPKLSKHSVTGRGVPLLVEELEAIGVNVDCADSFIGFGADLNFNTVTTTPSLKDYLTAAAGLAFGALKNEVMGRVFGNRTGYNAHGVEHSIKKPRIETVRDAVQMQVQKSMLQVIVKEAIGSGLNELSKAVKDIVPAGVI